MPPRPSAGGIILNPEGKIVLVEQHGNSWSFPKGGVEEGESELDAAKREIFEETGLKDIVLIENLGTYERYSIGLDGINENREWGLRPRTIFLFTTDAATTDLIVPDEEVTKVGYFTLDEALAILTHPKDKEFLQAVRERIEKVM